MSITPMKPEFALPMKPEFVLINWYTGALVGEGTEGVCRAQLEKISNGSSPSSADAFVIAEVKVLSKMKRVES